MPVKISFAFISVFTSTFFLCSSRIVEYPFTQSTVGYPWNFGCIVTIIFFQSLIVSRKTLFSIVANVIQSSSNTKFQKQQKFEQNQHLNSTLHFWACMYVFPLSLKLNLFSNWRIVAINHHQPKNRVYFIFIIGITPVWIFSSSLSH